jgi:hypothetical protein
MGIQRFRASSKPTNFNNGAVGYGPGGWADCIGPFAKVVNCPVAGTEVRLTCYATGHADTYFSVPAATKYKGKYVGGFFTLDEGGCVFNPYSRFKDRLLTY